jgi:3-deoxy-manno-octulosonate cytidylyltransferase (CMP-KDO synthetase)
MKIAAVIPCRYQSSRFEGKPLALIGDKPMMWHVYQQASKADSIAGVHIATDDERIQGVCKDLGMSVLMTSSDHLTGTDRVAECAKLVDADIIVNVQGDEPFILPESIDAVARSLADCATDVAATNAYCKIDNPEEVADPCVVKVLLSTSGFAMAYSRLGVPMPFRSQGQHFRQLGLYAFRRDSLDFFCRTRQGPVEQTESVEMYRFVENDRRVLMIEVEESGIAVDTPADLYKARLHFEKISGTPDDRSS